MKRAIIALALALAACAPIVQDARAPGVTLTRTTHDTYTAYRVDAREPLERLFLRFTGDNLRANAPECDLVNGALECIIGSITTFYELPIEGAVTNDWSLPAGIACRDGCYPIFLTN